DQAGDTTTTWNIPGVLTDSQILAQLGGTHPLATLKGYIAEQDRPDGVIQSVANDLRLGLMSFNDVGAATECSSEYLTNGIERFCPIENRDGAILLSELEDGDWVIDSNDPSYDSGKRRHVDELAQEINNIRATSWTPLGEALYGALGYYTQNSMFCLNVDANGKCLDWCLEVDSDGNCIDSADDDPVQYWCQDNHILVITEGESTADVNASVAGFAADPSSYFVTKTDEDDVAGDADADPDLTDDLNNDGTNESCKDSLYTSTYLDDMTWWANRNLPLYKERYLYDPDGNQNEKSTIFTHLVTTGTLTGTATGECNPDTLMQDAAVNGGTEQYYSGEDPQELEDNLYAVLGEIMTRASSGAAASVISNSRGG
ncbi:MAG: hypothetical protein D3909_18885, partial [Candidatus Electrothrix sp. ATG1]|nr:hypothetical protein [Candidatus Electrothrix sp. ATG1]